MSTGCCMETNLTINFILIKKEKNNGRGAWGAQSDKCPTLAQVLNSHELAVCEFKPCISLCAESSEAGACFRFCVSLSLCPFPAHALSLSLKTK